MLASSSNGWSLLVAELQPPIVAELQPPIGVARNRLPFLEWAASPGGQAPCTLRLRMPYVALVSDSRWQLFCLFRLNVPCSFTVTWLRIPGTFLLAVREKKGRIHFFQEGVVVLDSDLKISFSDSDISAKLLPRQYYFLRLLLFVTTTNATPAWLRKSAALTC